MVTDPNKAQIASSSTNLDPEIFVNKLNDISAQSKNSVDVGITNANPQDFEMSKSPNIFKGTTRFEDTSDCELFEDVTSDFSSAIVIFNSPPLETESYNLTVNRNSN